MTKSDAPGDDMTASGREASSHIDRLRRRRDGARVEVQRVTALIALQRDYLLVCEVDLEQAELALAALTDPASTTPPAAKPSGRPGRPGSPT